MLEVIIASGCKQLVLLFYDVTYIILLFPLFWGQTHTHIHTHTDSLRVTARFIRSLQWPSLSHNPLGL